MRGGRVEGVQRGWGDKERQGVQGGGDGTCHRGVAAEGNAGKV